MKEYDLMPGILWMFSNCWFNLSMNLLCVTERNCGIFFSQNHFKIRKLAYKFTYFTSSDSCLLILSRLYGGFEAHLYRLRLALKPGGALEQKSSQDPFQLIKAVS